MKCKDCIHEKACAAWIRHGETLYDDFEYSADDCPYYDEIRYGEWIKTYTVDWWLGTEKIDGYTCNQCARHFKIKGKYCPNCGAYMRGG